MVARDPPPCRRGLFLAACMNYMPHYSPPPSDSQDQHVSVPPTMATACAAAITILCGGARGGIDAQVLTCLSDVRDKIDMRDRTQRACGQLIDEDQTRTKVRGK